MSPIVQVPEGTFSGVKREERETGAEVKNG
jgi:hypothetical protein